MSKVPTNLMASMRKKHGANAMVCLRPICHPTSDFEMFLKLDTGVMTIACKRCEKPIVVCAEHNVMNP